MEKKDLNKLSFAELQEEVKRLSEEKKKVISKEKYWEIGSNYLIRTVTHIQVGRLIDITEKEFVLENASWVADTGRFHDMLKDGLESLDSSEIEPFMDIVIVNRDSLIDATPYMHKLPKTQK